MSDCRHRQDRTRHEFSRTDDGNIVEVLGCEKHGECTLADAGVVTVDLMAPADPDGCDHRGDKIREGEGTCCSGGPKRPRFISRNFLDWSPLGWCYALQ